MSRPAARPRVGVIVRGVLLLAIGRAAGLTHFPADRDGVLASLAPLIALPVAGALALLVHGDALVALTDLAQAMVGVLAPPVISHALAGWWGRRASWARYIGAYNWCQWLMPVLLVALLIIAAIAIQAGLAEESALWIPVGGVGAYSLWLHWFLARRALGLGGMRAAIHVAVVASGTAALVLVPMLLAQPDSGASQ